MVNVKFYYKGGCWLCDTAEEMLNGLKVKYDLKIEKIDIESEWELYAIYKHDIPVFEFKDGSTLNGKIRKKDLLERFEANKE